ncbi:MAG TPA: hypothetical protein VK964_00725 [Nocardioidaceae bacterium]|jgi:hypothetical protein|nr:hypothetical protein [Nocardioidaceae bacterium]
MIPLNAMTALWAVLLPLVDEVPRPEDVKPGWLGFGVFLLLAAAVVVLAFSFRKQLKKVDFEEKPATGESGETRDEPEGDEGGSPRTR